MRLNLIPAAAAVAALGLAALTAPAAHAQSFFGTVALDGAQERPTQVTTNGTGIGTFFYDEGLNRLTVTLSTQNLSSLITLAHIHTMPVVVGQDPRELTGPASLNIQTAAGFPNGVAIANSATGFNFGTVEFNSANGLNAEFVARMRAGFAYFNVHTQNFGGGEVRGNFVGGVTAVPEPGTVGLLALGALAGAVAVRRRRAGR